MRTTWAHLPPVRSGAAATARIACCAGERGSPVRGTYGPRAAPGTVPPTGTSTSGFGAHGNKIFLCSDFYDYESYKQQEEEKLWKEKEVLIEKEANS